MLFGCFLVFVILGNLGCQPQAAVPTVDYADDEVESVRKQIQEMDWD